MSHMSNQFTSIEPIKKNFSCKHSIYMPFTTYFLPFFFFFNLKYRFQQTKVSYKIVSEIFMTMILKYKGMFDYNLMSCIN